MGGGNSKADGGRSSKGCLGRETAFVMVFKLIKDAEKSWRKVDGNNQLPKVILGVKFTDGLEVVIHDKDIVA